MYWQFLNNSFLLSCSADFFAIWNSMQEAKLPMDRRWVLPLRIFRHNRWYHCLHRVQQLHLYHGRHLHFHHFPGMHQFYRLRPVPFLHLPPHILHVQLNMDLTKQPPRYNLSRSPQQNQEYHPVPITLPAEHAERRTPTSPSGLSLTVKGIVGEYRLEAQSIDHAGPIVYLMDRIMTVESNLAQQRLQDHQFWTQMDQTTIDTVWLKRSRRSCILVLCFSFQLQLCNCSNVFLQHPTQNAWLAVWYLFSVIDYIQFSSLVYVRCSTLYGSRYCNTLA